MWRPTATVTPAETVDPRLLSEIRRPRRSCKRLSSTALIGIFVCQLLGLAIFLNMNMHVPAVDSPHIRQAQHRTQPVVTTSKHGHLAIDMPSPPPLPPPQLASPLPPNPSSTAVLSTDASDGRQPPLVAAHGRCMEKPRGYWTYEVCIGQEVRQFHSMVRGVSRRAETSLGLFAEATEGHTHRYRGGAACTTGDHEPRQSDVTFTCGRADRITAVQEVTPCHYELNVELRSACEGAVESQRTASIDEEDQEGDG